MKKALVCLALVSAPLHHLVNAQCATPPLPCVAFREATIVAVVDVIERRAEPPTLDDEWLVVKLKVIERFKGLPPEQDQITLTIRNSFGPESSGDIKQGLRYLLYAYEWKGSLITACSRTKLVNTPIGLAEIGQLRRCAKEMIVQ